ncbi:MAG: hypothetical protein ACHQ0Y_12300 [Thermodesulfovibrionales bacterium]
MREKLEAKKLTPIGSATFWKSRNRFIEGLGASGVILLIVGGFLVVVGFVF